MTSLFCLAMAAGQGLACETMSADESHDVILYPTRDATLFESEKGDEGSAGRGFIFTGRMYLEPFQLRRALLVFDVAGALPASAQISSVELTLHLAWGRGEDDPIALHRMVGDWGEVEYEHALQAPPAAEGDSTWSHGLYGKEAWNEPGGDFVDAASAVTVVGTQRGHYTWGSTAAMIADVERWRSQPEENFGWILVAADEGKKATVKRLTDRTNADRAGWPRLKITFTLPE